MSDASLRFPAEGLAFLRALKRHNDREWFRARKDNYERLVRAPMIAIIEQLAVDFRTFAPDVVASPKTSLYRIYRDTRFSDDKSPLKTHIAAVFPRRGLPKHQGAGLYFHVAPDEVWVGGGLYAPDAAQLFAVREHIAANHVRLRAIVSAPGFRRVVGGLKGATLQRVPRGFPRDHEAADYLKHRQFLASKAFPATFATTPQFYRGLISVFKQVAPLAAFLNEPLTADRAGPSARI